MECCGADVRGVRRIYASHVIVNLTDLLTRFGWMKPASTDTNASDTNSGTEKGWHTAIKTLEEVAESHKWLTTVVLFGFILIKVVWMARGNIQTALGIFNSAGTVTVIVGGLLSAFPLVSALVLGLVIFELARKFPSGVERIVWLIGLAAAVGCFFLTPWPIAAVSVLLGTFSGLVMKIKKKVMQRILLSFLLLASIGLIVHPLLYSVWLPRELLTVPKLGSTKQMSRQDVAGYVLSDSNGWVSLLQTGQRTITRYRSEEVVARVLCQGQTVPMPGAPRWYKSGDSPWETLFPRDSGPLPPCSGRARP
jgi:hypothetical protein